QTFTRSASGRELCFLVACCLRACARNALVAAGVFAGAALGIKYSAAQLAVPCAICAVLALRRGEPPLRAVLLPALVALAFLLVTVRLARPRGVLERRAVARGAVRSERAALLLRQGPSGGVRLDRIRVWSGRTRESARAARGGVRAVRHRIAGTPADSVRPLRLAASAAAGCGSGHRARRLAAAQPDRRGRARGGRPAAARA